jgi:FKBP12-rapamycin complex-associated protein
MSSLANSASLHSPNRTIYSIRTRSVRALSIAQEMAVVEALTDDPADPAAGAAYLDPQQEVLTDKAVIVIRRVMDKLTGLDFYDPSSLAPPTALDVPEQVDRLIIQATSNENLCLSFLGWCPFW